MMTIAHMVAALALGVVVAVPAVWAEGEGDETPFDEASIFFELNDTDGDLGIHSLVDGDAWASLEMRDPDDQYMLKARVKGRLGRQGLTELFFESAEPTFDELPPKKFFFRFPEGEYEIAGTTLEGEELESTVEVTHLLPAPPANVRVSGQEAAENCDVVPLPVVSEPVIISWNLVTMSHPELGRTNEPIEVARYEVVVEQDDFTLNVTLPPNATTFTVPADFIALGDEFKFEIVVREEGGNQTALESCFEVQK
jgi:hypothetical protein